MARPGSRHPTELELAILKILWKSGPATVRQVRDTLAENKDLAYTSVMTILGIMTRKGYARRAKQGNGYVYTARLSEAMASKSMLQDLVDRLFEGSASAVMQHLIETSDLDAEELKRIRQLISRKAKDRS